MAMRRLGDYLTVGEIEAQLQEALDKEGLVVVPREPTDAMIDAALVTTAAWLDIKGSALVVNREKMRRRYKAMIETYEKGQD